MPRISRRNLTTPCGKNILRVKGTHDGMDYLEFKSFFNALRNDDPMEIDVYDAVSLMIVSSLSEQSVALGGAPVAFPDFTGGKWTKKEGVLR